MANKGVELINKVNQHDKLIKDGAVKLSAEVSERYQLAKRVNELTDKLDKRDKLLDEMMIMHNLHNESIKRLIRDRKRINRDTILQGIAIILLGIGMIAQGLGW